MHYQVYRITMPEKLSPTRNKFGGVWKYLTFLNMLLQFIFFTIAFLSNFVKQLRPARDLIFASAAFPIGMFVGIIFWSIWAVDRELIFPKILDEYFPAILNHCMHTTVIPLQLGQLCLVKHNFPSRSKGFTITGILCLGYMIWINYIYYMGGFWVYPVIKVRMRTGLQCVMGHIYNWCSTPGPFCWPENLFLCILWIPWRSSLSSWRRCQQDDLGKKTFQKEELVNSNECRNKLQG